MKKITIFIAMSCSLLISCSFFNNKFISDRQNIDFMNYLKSHNIDPDTVKVFSKYYEEHYYYRKEQKIQTLAKNPYLYIDKVYADYGNTNIYLYIHSDNGIVYKGEVTITDPLKVEIVGNKVILKKPVITKEFRSFDLEGDKLYVNNWENKSYNKKQKWIWVLTAKKDTLQFTELYRAKNQYIGIKKQIFSKRKKYNNYYLIYQPNLKVEKRNETFFITGNLDLINLEN